MIWPWPESCLQPQGEIEFGLHLSPQQAVELSLWIARKGNGFVSPNPMVGCVILDKDQRLIALGHHERFGGPHAEVRAVECFEKRGFDRNLLKGQSHFFVSLEPCAHFGKTPPCADLLAEIKPLSVTIALGDPNPNVSGKGIAKLRASGIRAEVLSETQTWPSLPELPIENHVKEHLTELAQDLNETFLYSMRPESKKMPFVALKLASTLDGRVAMRDGESKWITGPRARERGREMRKECDVVLTTARTVLNDNPKLDSIDRANRVVILDSSDFVAAKVLSRDSVKSDLEILKVRDSKDVQLVVDQSLSAPIRDRIEKQGIEVVPIQGLTVLDRNERLMRVLEELRSKGVMSCFLEGGAALVSAALQSAVVQASSADEPSNLGCVHRVHHFLNASYLGGVNAASLSRGLSIPTLHNRLKLLRVRVGSLADTNDWMSPSFDFHLTGTLPLALPLFERALSQPVGHPQDADSATEVLG